ncbi:MAG: BatA domain-containing protein [Pirellulaceae bacterium]|nr:BatA domain-containing protein [Planctomycetales bacterium]
MQFLHQPLTWGFFLVLLPVLIHLINLMRQRRVRWAAMDFLLKAYKKHRKWIWLKQLLLLLLRMLAVAVVVAMLAKLVSQDRWSQWLGGQTTHHILVLDDSLSMSERLSTGTVFDLATQAITQLADNLSERPGQRVTLLRTSQAARAWQAVESGEDQMDAGGAAGLVADLNAVYVDSDFAETLEEKRRGFDITDLSYGPRAALQLVSSLIQQNEDEQHVVYLVSDFRHLDWESPEQVRELLQKMQTQGASIQLVRCAAQSQDNLAITEIRPELGTRAAGVPLMVDVTVKNFGDRTARQIPISIRLIDHTTDKPASDPATAKGTPSDLPGLLIDELPPGESIVRHAQVYFPGAGYHVVQASLPPDTMDRDNQRGCVLHMPDAISILIVDGDEDQIHGRFLTDVFQPNPQTRTGIAPTLQVPAFLRDATPEMLGQFSAIYLADVDRLDSLAVDNLKQYVSAGGGLAFFMGPNSSVSFYNELYEEGIGLFPVPLENVAILERDLAEVPDLVPGEHPLLRVFAGQQNPFAESVRVDQYVRAVEGWKPPLDSSITILAELRNRQPLIVERTFGQGRVVTFLTTLAPTWNNWARQPSFVVIALELQAYLQTPLLESTSQTAGSPIALQLEANDYQREVQFVVPGRSDSDRRVIIQMIEPNDDSPLMNVRLENKVEGSERIPTARAGIYEAWATHLDGKNDVRRFAVNGDSMESDLHVVDNTELLSQLQPVKVTVVAADRLDAASDTASDSPISQWLVFVAIGLLIVEQVTAYSASYHPPVEGALR